MRAVVLGSSGAIGGAVARSLGDQVVGLSRAVGLDWIRPDVAETALLGAGGPFDLVFDATGALIIDGAGPEKKLADIDPAAMAAQFAVNAVGPALVFKHYRSLIPRRGRAVIATLSARVGSIGDNGLGGWISYRASKAALNQIVRTASIEIARWNPEAICIALHPGTVATRLSDPFAGGRDRVTPEQAAANLLSVIDGLTPTDTGGFFAWDGTPIPW
ncbi:MAG: SDR family NAD(P)-dependent oxidoreductase [Pseudomonadota bacterium]